MTFNPAGTVTLRPASADVYAAPQTAGQVNVTTDSTLTVATLTADFVAGTTVTGITAHAGGGQADATPLTAQTNVIGTCATATDSVVLPAAAPVGAAVFVRNDGSKAAQVFAVDPGTINAVATGTGVALNAGASATYRIVAADTWVT